MLMAEIWKWRIDRFKGDKLVGSIMWLLIKRIKWKIAQLISEGKTEEEAKKQANDSGSKRCFKMGSG
jgi:hypothetical protein